MDAVDIGQKPDCAMCNILRSSGEPSAQLVQDAPSFPLGAEATKDRRYGNETSVARGIRC